jgi:hypothetical protein
LAAPKLNPIVLCSFWGLQSACEQLLSGSAQRMGESMASGRKRGREPATSGVTGRKFDRKTNGWFNRFQRPNVLVAPQKLKRVGGH